MNLFTIPELAKLIGKSRQWVWHLVKINTLPAKKVGGVFILKEENLPENIRQLLKYHKREN